MHVSVPKLQDARLDATVRAMPSGLVVVLLATLLSLQPVTTDLNGFFMIVVAFGIGSWLGTRMNGTVLPLTNGIWFWSVWIALSAWVGVHQYGHQNLPAATPL